MKIIINYTGVEKKDRNYKINNYYNKLVEKNRTAKDINLNFFSILKIRVKRKKSLLLY